MSRSRKRTPYAGDSKNRDMKAIANKRLRRALKRDYNLVFKGKEYRKYTNSYDICDFYYIEDLTFNKYYERELSRWYEAQILNSFWNYGYKVGDPAPTKREAWKKYCRRYVWK